MHIATAALLFLVALPGAAGAEDYDERIPAGPGGRLEVDVDLGKGLRPDPGFLEVSSHDADEIRLLVDSSGWSASGVSFRIEPGERTVRIYGRVTGAITWLFGGPRIEVRIWVPREFSVDLRASGGSIRVEDVRGNVRARAGAGAIEVMGSEGAVHLRTADGGIRVSEVVGDVDVKAASGDIELAWITGDVDARTGAGQIEAAHVRGAFVASSDRGDLEIRELEGAVAAKTERGGVYASFLGRPTGSLETRRGDVEVLIPAGRGIRLEALTRRGAVELADGVAFRGTREEGRAVGSVNGGGAPLRLYTAQGGVHLHER